MLLEQNETRMDPKAHDRELGPDDTPEPRKMSIKHPGRKESTNGEVASRPRGWKISKRRYRKSSCITVVA